MTYNTIFDKKVDWKDFKFNYQSNLTEKLDNIKDSFDQATIDQIVLWKVNRYAELNDETLSLLNKIEISDKQLNNDLTKEVLRKLLDTKGIRLPMASTILRFKNPNLYQIIDQRAYRVIYNSNLALPSNIDEQIEIYLSYLTKVRSVCQQFDIDFNKADRMLYWADKEINKDKKIKY